jgi:hypothetical protein
MCIGIFAAISFSLWVLALWLLGERAAALREIGRLRTKIGKAEGRQP